MINTYLPRILLSVDAGEAAEKIQKAGEDIAQEVTDTVTQSVNDGTGLLQTWLTGVRSDAISLCWSSFLALVCYFFGVRIVRGLSSWLKKGMMKRGVDTGVCQFLEAVLKIAGYGLLLVLILGIFGIAPTSIAAAVASMGLTAGLALQGALSNFAGGILILMLKPFVVGDYIYEDTHGNEGNVKEISIFYTKLITIDNKLIVIPNGVLANTSLKNYTSSGKRQEDIKITLAYSTDLQIAKQILARVIMECSRRLEGEDVLVYVSELGSDGIDVGMRFWVRADDYWPVRWETLERAKGELDAAGIEIPYHQMDVHIQND